MGDGALLAFFAYHEIILTLIAVRAFTALINCILIIGIALSTMSDILANKAILCAYFTLFCIRIVSQRLAD